MTEISPGPEPEMRPGDDLAGRLAWAWALLARGVADRRSPVHTPTVATVGLDGAPRLRTVVLRAVEASAWRVRFHTDARSPKVAELAADARIALHAYDPGLKLQLRLEGVAVVHAEGPEHAAAWAASRPQSRECYRCDPGPGVEIDDPGAVTFAADDPQAATRFRAVWITVARMECLTLAASGHRRSRHARAPRTDVWLVP